MRFDDCICYRIDLFSLCLINQIFMVHTAYRFVRRNFDNIHSINITKFLFFGQRRTSHTGFFLIFIKKILESNRCQRLTFAFYLHAFLRFNCLMKTVRITASRHDTSGKFINDQHLIIFDHIIMISVHQVMSPESQNNIMLDFQILRIGQIINMEELFDLLHAIFSQRYIFLFFIDNIISGFDNLFTHNGRHLRHLTAGLAPFHLTCKDITGPVKLCRLSALAGNDQRCSGLVDQDRVNLIDNRIVKSPLNQLFFINNHVVSQVIKSQLIIRRIGNIAGISCFSLFRCHTV